MNGAPPAADASVATDLPQPFPASESAMVSLTVASWEALKAERDGLQQQVQELRGAAETSRRRWDQVVENAHEWAGRNNLCSEYDRFLEDNDLPPRITDFDITVDVRLEVVITRAGHSEQDAAEGIGSPDICEMLYGMDRDALRTALDDFTIVI